MDQRPQIQRVMSHEELHTKRFRQRTYVKQAYDRQERAMTALKRQAAMLETQHSELLGQSQVIAAATSATKEPLAQWSVLGRLGAQRLHNQYQALAKTKSSLTGENEILHDAIATRENHFHRMRHLVEMRATPFYVQLIPRPLVDQTISDARAQSQRFVPARHSSNTSPMDKLPTSQRVLGWQYERCVANGSFSLTKLFHGVSAASLLQRSWAILSSPAKYVALYSVSLQAELHLLQHVDSDTLLYYTKLGSGPSGPMIKSVYLLHKEPMDRGYMVMLRSIDHTQVEFDHDGINTAVEEVRAACIHQYGTTRKSSSNAWAKISLWLVFQDHGSNSCLYKMGGSSHHAWALEVVLIAMRWQILVFGYEPLLPSHAQE